VRTFYVVRHAKAGSRGRWTGDDRLRPLTKKGQKQADALVETFEKLPIKSIFSSPYLRCTQTVEPLSHVLKLPVKSSIELAEGHGLEGLNEFLGNSNLDHAVLSTHGDIVWELVEELVSRHVVRAGDGGFDKGSTWVVRVQDGVPVKARYIPAP
jgi:phosphohistidine phosphatase SixA